MSLATNHDTITVGVFDLRFLIESTDSNGSAAVFECSVPAGARMPARERHDGFDETIYGLEGLTTWTIDGETVEIGPGEAVCVTRGQIFGFENHGGVDARSWRSRRPALVGPAYFRETRRGPRRRRRRPAGPGRDRRDQAPPRPHPRRRPARA